MTKQCSRCGGSADLLQLTQCHHTVCLLCLKARWYASQDGGLENKVLTCPLESCSDALLAIDVLHFLAPTTFDNYANNRLSNLLLPHKEAPLPVLQKNRPLALLVSLSLPILLIQDLQLAIVFCLFSGLYLFGPQLRRLPSTLKHHTAPSWLATCAACRGWELHDYASHTDGEEKAETEEQGPLRTLPDILAHAKPAVCPACSQCFCPLCPCKPQGRQRRETWTKGHEHVCGRRQLLLLCHISEQIRQYLNREKEQGTITKTCKENANPNSARAGSKSSGKGTGYGGGYLYEGSLLNALFPSTAHTQRQADEDQQLTARLTSHLVNLPPEPYYPEHHALLIGSCHPHTPTTAPLPRLLRRLLLNDSLLDIAQRPQPILEPAAQEPARGKKGRKASGTQEERARSNEGWPAGSLIDLLANLQKQAQFLQRTDKQQEGRPAKRTRRDERDHSLAIRILQVYETAAANLLKFEEQVTAWQKSENKIGAPLEAEAAQERSKQHWLWSALHRGVHNGEAKKDIGWRASERPTRRSTESLEERYKRVLGSLSFSGCELLQMAEGKACDIACPMHAQRIEYHFLHEANKAAAHKRMTRLMQEISSLSTSLPVEYASSIFVRVDESRPDCLKALIIGPEGTPYQNGVFEFDILMPSDYPSRPPHVHFMTTGGNTVRMNPNLYADGKVCLSLLGTWAGPGWKANESTLLQVLVSIQSLILVPDPYFNEPGHGLHAGQPNTQRYSEDYNRRTRQYVLGYAINHPLHEALSGRAPVWGDVILRHFALKRDEVLRQISEWTLSSGQANGSTVPGNTWASSLMSYLSKGHACPETKTFAEANKALLGRPEILDLAKNA